MTASEQHRRRPGFRRIVPVSAMVVTMVISMAVSIQSQNVTGSGTVGVVPVWTGTTKIGNSMIEQKGGAVWLGLSPVSGFTFSVRASNGIGASTTGVALFGTSNGSNGVEGITIKSGFAGVLGVGTGARGVEGHSDGKGAVVGFSGTNAGVVGVSNGTTSFVSVGVLGISAKEAGYFQGQVFVQGNFAVTGVKAFRIDHPLDPANKYLTHSAVESSEVLNVYSGKVILDGSGEALVRLPDWFETLNTDFRYQLTAIGQPGPDLYVAEEIRDNQLRIAGGHPGMKVSWQVTGVRQDAWVKAHPMEVESEKPPNERGFYLNPELFGQPEERGITWLYHPDVMTQYKANRLANAETSSEQ